MDIKEAAHIDAAEHSDGDTAALGGGSTARRRVLVAGLSGAAVSLVPFLTRRAGAAGGRQVATGGSSDGTFTANSTDSFNDSPTDASTGVSTGDDTVDTSNVGASQGSDGGFNGTGDSTNASTDDTAGVTGDSTADSAADVTTTTAPPKRPTDDDITLLSFAQSVELTIRDLYDSAIAQGVFEGAQLEAINVIREDHEAYANSFSGLLGRTAPNTALADLFNDHEADFGGSAEDVAAAAQALENTAVATHLNILGELVGIDGAGLLASMLIIEARHATVLAAFAGIVDLDEQLASEADPLELADFSTN